jgi:DNA-binding NarL/FixJ family response regulator
MRESARELVVSRNGGHHVFSILGKLGVRTRTRTEAAAEAVRLGIVGG